MLQIRNYDITLISQNDTQWRPVCAFSLVLQKSVGRKMWLTCKQLINLKFFTRAHTVRQRDKRRNGLPRSDQMKDPQGLEKRDWFWPPPSGLCLEKRQIMLNVAFSGFYYYSLLFSHSVCLSLSLSAFALLELAARTSRRFKRNANRHNRHNNNNNGIIKKAANKIK